MKDPKYDELLDAARHLIYQLEVVHNDPDYKSLFVQAMIHGRPYNGSTYTDAFERLKGLVRNPI